MTGLGRLLFIMDAAEVEFLAEKELVTIIPNFSLDKIYLIGVSLGGTGRRPGVMLGSPLLVTRVLRCPCRGTWGPSTPAYPWTCPCGWPLT